MTILAAQNLFRNGLMALVDGRPQDAVVAFREAMQIEKSRGTRHRQVRYLSYYGLSLALASKATSEAVHACETAVRLDPLTPDLHLNLGRVYALTGRTTRALASFERGLEIAPTHRGLIDERGRLDRRGRPPLRFLDRAHPLNHLLGKLRSSVGRSAAPTSSPASAG